MRKVWPLIFWVLLLAACSRDKEVLIPGNQAPPDGTVEDVVLESYINRSYITLLGLQPNPAQLAQGLATLRSHNASQADRSAYLDQVIAQPPYSYRMFDIARAALLNAVDTSAIRDELYVLDFILSDSAYLPFWPMAQVQHVQYLAVLDIPADLRAGTINVAEMHRRLVTNNAYDQINMGSLNFVISMFQNFLERYPTDSERDAADIMVNGFSAQVFLQNGRSKTDFIAIFLNSDDYLEGQVRGLFKRYLFRSPTTQELESLTIAYKNSGDYQALQKAILTTDEFVGL